MRNRLSSILWLISVVLLGTGCTHNRSNDIVQLFVDGHDIRQVVVVEVPRDVFLQGAFTPETLQQFYHQKLELRAGAFLRVLPDLKIAIDNTKCETPARATDLRTGIVLLDANGVTVRSVYYGLDPNIGEIDGVSCRLNNALYRWVRTEIHE
jgi:hypothetical protein